MLSKEENELLTQTGTRTPMGELFRRFWLPVLLAEEIASPDCAPVRVRVLGENLVAFRDTQGRIGLLDGFCAHRSAELFYGRNEECGLRCVYHGWKYDVEGNCVEMPNEPPERYIKIRLTSYPCRERAGLIWAYMGPGDQMPEMPELEWARVPDSHRYISKYMLDGNYLQVLEGDIDNSHVPFLHRFLNPQQRVATGKVLPGPNYDLEDTVPKITVKDTDYGCLFGWRRNADQEHFYWRVTHWLAPTYVMVGAPGPGDTIRCQARLPLDDESSCLFRVEWNPDRPLTADELTGFKTAGLVHGEVIPGTYRPVANRENNFQIDRTLQRTYNYTGIRSQTAQDWAVTLSQGRILDRSKEHLVASDAAIVAVRRRLRDMVLDLKRGKEPFAAHHGQSYRVRPCGALVKREVPVEEGAKDLMIARV